MGSHGSVVSNLGEHSNMRIAFFLIVVATINFTSARPKDGPLNMEALNMLHADAVKYGQGAKNNKWFEAVDAKTLDGMITQMNTKEMPKKVKVMPRKAKRRRKMREEGIGEDIEEGNRRTEECILYTNSFKTHKIEL